MKPALNQQAVRTTTGTQNWTDPSITSDQVLALFFGSNATANNTTGANGRLFLGASDLANDISFDAMDPTDASAAGSTNATTQGSSTKSIFHTIGGTLVVGAARSATLSNGITENYSAANGTAYLLNCLSLAGTDIQSACSSIAFASTDTSKTITHGLSGTPEAMLITIAVGSTGSESGGFPARPIILLWDGTNTVSATNLVSSNSSPTLLAGRLNTDGGTQLDNSGANIATFSIGSVGSSTFTLSRTATGSTPLFVTCTAIRHLSGTWAAKAGITTLPTSTGIASFITGMSVQPQVLITVATRLTSTALATNSDAAGSLSFGVACNNNSTTQQMAAAVTNQNAVTTTVSKSYTSNAAALLSLDNTGAVANQASVSSWNSDGVSLNHTAVGGNSFEVMYLAFGISNAAPPPPSYNLSSDIYF